MQKLQNIKRIAVIGGGPAGVAAAKYLLAEKAFTQIDIFEQRSTCAGVWNYTSENDREAHFSIPQTKPYSEEEKPIWRIDDEPDFADQPPRKHATFISPLYERLEANLPKMIMQYAKNPFPEDSQLFPTHETITKYLEKYAEDIYHLIQFETQTVQINPISSRSGKCWSVITKNLRTGERKSGNYDAVAVASGHFTVPLIPDVPGIKEWNRAHPKSISHSKFFRRPEDFSDKKVLTIGVGYSGIDIANQIEPLCQSPLLVSSRSTSPLPDNTATRLNLPAVAEFIPAARAIRFADGQVIESIDVVIFCTGYLYSYPFLSPSPLPSAPILTNGSRTHNMYQQIFYNADPTLAFLTIPQRIVPFPVSESQSAVIAGVWAGRLALPDLEEMQTWERNRVNMTGDNKTFHYLSTPEDCLYVNMLHDWVMHDDPADALKLKSNGMNGRQPLSNGIEQKSLGKQPPYWGEKEFWIRERVPDIKKAFADLGEGRHKVRTLEELGFDFAEWKKSNENTNGDLHALNNE